MASLETRLARGAAQDAASEWKRHAAGCPRCARLSHDRQAQPCATGAEIRNELTRLRAEARKQAELDKQPAAGQSTLF